MTEGVDYAGARPPALCLKAAGKHFAGRYFGPGGKWKHATCTEVSALRVAGVAVVALAEGDKYDPRDGEPRGRAHAIAADAAVRAAGMGYDIPIYFAVDWDAQPSEFRVIAHYLYGVAATIGRERTGIYGGYDVIKWAADTRNAQWFFQTYAWSGGKWFAGNHIEQYRNRQTVCGGEVDLCRSRKVDFGQWPRVTQTIGQAPPAPSDSTVDTGWDFTRHVDTLADTVGDLGKTVDGAAGAIEAID